MSAITPRLNTASVPTGSISSATAESSATGPSTSSSDRTDISAYNYAQVQNQVWHWKPNDTGLDMP